MSVLAALVDLVLPSWCVGCGAQGGALCAACVRTQGVLPAGPWVWAAGGYDGALRAALLAYKERGRRDLAAPLSTLLGGSVGAALTASRSPPGRVALVCVPSARSVAAARGGDHVWRLARKVSRDDGLRLARDVLRLTRDVRDSAGLNSADRAANLIGAMAARPPSGARAALLVDDIVTTGSTLREARRALETGGWDVVGAAVVAATARRAVTHRPPTSSTQEHGLA